MKPKKDYGDEREIIFQKGGLLNKVLSFRKDRINHEYIIHPPTSFEDNTVPNVVMNLRF